MTKEMREEVCLSFATKRNMTEGSGCKFEKNSVNCPCKDGDNMPRKERDYKAEYAREKEKGWKKNTSFTVNLTPEKKVALDAKLALEPKGEDGKPISRNGLLNKWIDMYLAGQLD